MNGRYCIGSQPFKYFMETDPTVPMWVKKIQQNDIETWNKHIIIDNNEISFDHDIDLMASDFQYIPIGVYRDYNIYNVYYKTFDNETYSTIILDESSFYQYKNGLYIKQYNSSSDVLTNDSYTKLKSYKTYDSNFDYYYKTTNSDQDNFYDKILVYNNIDDYENIIDSYNTETLYILPSYGDIIFFDKEYRDNNIDDLEEFAKNNHFYSVICTDPNYFTEHGTNSYGTFYIVSLDEFNNDINIREHIYTKNEYEDFSYVKINASASFVEDEDYYVYNNYIYSTISLNENTFKERQNGLYIRTSVWDKDTLLTAKNIDQLMYDLVDTAYAHAKDTAYQNFVTNQLKDYVNGKIASLNLNTYATNTALNNLITRFNILANQVNYIDDEVGDISSTREYLITTGNGLKKTYINEGTLNQVAHLDLNIRPMPDGYLNEETKKYLHLEDGYNGFYIFNDLIYQDWIYKLTPQGDYIPDGEGGWQKEQLDHYVIGMPFTERLVPARVAVSSRAVLEELNDNYEMKLITLGSNVQIVDLAYYKQLWGATGATFTEADFKALTAEWYDVNWDYDTPENQAIMKMYTYNGENGERLYRHQRAITFIPSESGDIYAADDDGTEIDSSVVEMYFKEKKDATGWENYWKAEYDDHGTIIAKHRKETVWEKIDNELIYVPEDADYDSSKTYYLRGSINSKYTVPSCDAVARYVESEIGKLDVTEVGGTNKYISAISETDGKISATTGNIDTSVVVL